MQEISKRIKARAIELLSDGTVNRVIGWEKGESETDWSPALFETVDEMQFFMYGKYAGANLSKYCLKFNTAEGKTLVVLKPCDTLSFRQLIHEHRLNREKFYIIGAGCKGMADEKGTLLKCNACKGKDFEVYDEIIDDEESRNNSGVIDRMDGVRDLENMTAQERYDFWRGELSRCIRCNACRNVCPACTCVKCVFDNPNSGVQSKAPVTDFEENMFHIIRAYHVAGRCTDCGECSRVCPQNIPLHLLNRKFIKDMNELYGDFQAGVGEEERHPLTSYTKEDVEPGVVHERGERLMRLFSADKVLDIVKSIPGAVYAPVDTTGGMVTFERYEDGMNLRLDKIATDKSPKDILFPQWENLMHFRMEGKTIELTEQERSEEDYVLFGARACDIQAFKVLDRVFLADPVDTYYAARREHGAIVALACSEPKDSCFCKNFGVDPAQPDADVVLWLVGDDYYCEAYTDKGRALMEKWDTQEADAAPVEWIKGEIAKKYDALPFAKLNLNGFDGDHLMEKFNSPKWKKLSMACLGCGSCTFACPTCQCYDIRDYDNGSGVQRYRCWDSCMYSDFTLMAHGTNRPTQLERYRQRFMHKLVYFPANNDGMYSCVGCGRCIEKCPMNLNIVKVIKALGEEDK